MVLKESLSKWKSKNQALNSKYKIYFFSQAKARRKRTLHKNLKFLLFLFFIDG